MPTKTDNQSAAGTLVNMIVRNGQVLFKSASSSLLTWTDSRTGTSNPGWKSQIRRGLSATTEYNCSFRKHPVVQMHAYGRIIEKVPKRDTILSLDGTPSTWLTSIGHPIILSSHKADRSARLQFLKRYRERRTQMQSGVTLGELRETVKMIRNPAQALRRGIDDYHKGVKKRLNGAKNRNRVIQDTWLEYQFGWKPLISDIEDACRLATAHPARVYETIVGHSSDTQFADTSPGYIDALPLRVHWTNKTESSVEVKYKGAIGFENDPPGFPEQLGLSWSNVLPTIWELIPYSFLVDYFTNVGKVIDGIATGRIALAWGCKIQVDKTERYVSNLKVDVPHLDQATPEDGKFYYGASGGGMTGSRTDLFRWNCTGVSVGLRDLHMKLPGSDTKWLNIGALAKLRR